MIVSKKKIIFFILRRGDGGRFSMRSAANNVRDFQNSLRPPFKINNSNTKTFGFKVNKFLLFFKI